MTIRRPKNKKRNPDQRKKLWRTATKRHVKKLSLDNVATLTSAHAKPYEPFNRFPRKLDGENQRKKVRCRQYCQPIWFIIIARIVTKIELSWVHVRAKRTAGDRRLAKSNKSLFIVFFFFFLSKKKVCVYIITKRRVKLILTCYLT